MKPTKEKKKKTDNKCSQNSDNGFSLKIPIIYRIRKYRYSQRINFRKKRPFQKLFWNFCILKVYIIIYYRLFIYVLTYSIQISHYLEKKNE